MTSISFDRAVEFYDATRGYPPGVDEQIADAIAAAVGATAETRFLEMGIGTGRIAFPLIKRGYHYTGIDLSAAMMGRLREKIDAFAATHPDQPVRVDLHIGDSTVLPFADAQFNVVLTVHVLHLISNWRDAIDGAVRVLTPGGYFLNCGDDLLVRGDTLDIKRRWEEIVEDLGFTPDPAYSGTAQAVFSYLGELGLQPEVLRTATWQVERRPRDMFEHIAQRLWSRTWRVPDDLFAESIRRLKEQLQDTYGDRLDLPEQRTLQFVITRARKL